MHIIHHLLLIISIYILYMFNFFLELKNKCNELKGKISPYQLVMVGDSVLYVEGKIVLMTLAKDSIVFKVEGGVIIVNGKNLTLKDISENTITITGKICSWEKV